MRSFGVPGATTFMPGESGEIEVKYDTNRVMPIRKTITVLSNADTPTVSLKIKGNVLTKNKVTLKANVSSQYISALLLIAPKLENGLELTLEGEITSVPYIKMTLDLLNQIGVETVFDDDFIKVKPLNKNIGTENVINSNSFVNVLFSVFVASHFLLKNKINPYSAKVLSNQWVASQILAQ